MHRFEPELFHVTYKNPFVPASHQSFLFTVTHITVSLSTLHQHCCMKCFPISQLIPFFVPEATGSAWASAKPRSTSRGWKGLLLHQDNHTCTRSYMLIHDMHTLLHACTHTYLCRKAGKDRSISELSARPQTRYSEKEADIL